MSSNALDITTSRRPQTSGAISHNATPRDRLEELHAASRLALRATLRTSLHMTLFAALLALLASCGGASLAKVTQTSGAVLSTDKPSEDRMLPVKAPKLTVALMRGAALARPSGQARFAPLPLGQGARNIVAIRGGESPCLITLGSGPHHARGKLWLRAGAELAWGQTTAGEVRLRLLRGEARLSLFSVTPPARLQVGKTWVGVGGQDILIARNGRGVHVTPTALDVDAAEWTLALLEATRPVGVGSLSVRRHATGRDADARAHLALASLKVNATTVGDVAEVRVEHVFHNDSAERLEGTFRFPLPEGASLLGLAMEIDGKLRSGELVARDKARRVYEAIVDEMRDPALLEWEQGQIFKLRVFPIEPHKDKRVVLRYLAPLATAPANPQHRVFRYDTAAPGMQRAIPHFSLVVDGKRVIDTRGFSPGRSLEVALPDGDRGARHETRADGVYTALRLVPNWRALVAGVHGKGVAGNATQSSLTSISTISPAAPRDLVVVVDTSRSALETHDLAIAATKTLLASLTSRDRFLVIAADVTARDQAPAFVPMSHEALPAAVSFLRGIEADGATDLAATLRHIGTKLRDRKDKNRRAQIVYIGDGTPTWGITARTALTRLTAGALDATPLHALVLGRGTNSELLASLAAQQGGRLVRARRPHDVRRLALALSRPEALRLRNVTIRAGENDEIFPHQMPTVFFGEAMSVLVRTPAGHASPKHLTLSARLDGHPVILDIPVKAPREAPHVAHRWARAKLVALRATDADKKTLIATSLRYGVMCKHTAFLVLESEAAYKRWGIARSKHTATPKSGANAPKISGGDLESLGARRARLSPNQLQPGDPEVRIPAPADAKRVVVVFPFGVTKIAHYETALRAWTVRFLVAHGTPDGTYHVVVRVTHADDRVEILRLSYVVDSQAPWVTLRLRKTRHGYRVIATQRVSKRALIAAQTRQDKAQAGGAIVTEGGVTQLQARIIQDAYRVDVRLPTGKVLRLYRHRKLGHFSRIWRLKHPIDGPVDLRVVAVDRAYNRRVETLRFDPETNTLTRLEVR